jgi:hypothetical protein
MAANRCTSCGQNQIKRLFLDILARIQTSRKGTGLIWDDS